MEIVVGLSLKNLKPRVWDPDSEYYLPQVRAVMVSYAEFDQMRKRRSEAMEVGLHAFLGVQEGAKVYLDNGSFALHRKERDVPAEEYVEFVETAKPDWYPPPRDYIPAPSMAETERATHRERTMKENLSYSYDGYVPVVHVGHELSAYVESVQKEKSLSKTKRVALGGIVPNLLRAPSALPYRDVLDGLAEARRSWSDKELHVFGIGGTATLHLAALLRMDSVDSSGWRNRAARGIVQMPGRGDRLVADLGSWRGRVPSEAEWAELEACLCPACRSHGTKGLKASGVLGFCNRATHNLQVLLDEADLIGHHLGEGYDSYERWYVDHVENTIYRPLIEYALEKAKGRGVPPVDS